MKVKYKILFSIVLLGSVLLLIGGFSYYTINKSAMTKQVLENNRENAVYMSNSVGNDLLKLVRLTKTLASADVINDSLIASNDEFSSLSASERNGYIDELNTLWMNTDDINEPFILNRMENDAASYLVSLQDEYPDLYGEIFLTNKYGVMISTTGKLTTLAHFEKYWWQEAYNDGEGITYLDDRGFDVSVDGYVLGIVVPIYDDYDEIIGILKSNYNISNIFERSITNYRDLNSVGEKYVVRTLGLIVNGGNFDPLSQSISDDIIPYIEERTYLSIEVKVDGVPSFLTVAPITTTYFSDSVSFGGKYESIDHSDGNQGEGWSVVHIVDKQVALMELGKSLRIYSFVTFVMLLFLSVVTLYIGGKLEKEIIVKEEIKKILLISEKRYRELIQNIEVGVIVYSIDKSVILNNEKACELLGLSDDMIKGKKEYEPAWKLVKENMENLPQEEYPINLIIATKKSLRNVIFGVVNPVFSEVVWLSINGTPYLDKYGEIQEIIVSFSNITEMVKRQAKISESIDRLDRSQKVGSVGSWELDLSTNLIWASKETFNIYELPRDSEFVDLEYVQKLVSHEDREMMNKALLNSIENGDSYDVLFTINKGSKKKYIHSKAVINKDNFGKANKVIGVLRDVTELKKKEDELIYLSYYDSLTGLHNRRYYEENLVEIDIPNNYPLTIVMSDINGLKLINDAFGHLAGDELLISAAKIISNSCRKTDLVARIGGDEFVIFMPNTNEIEAEEVIDRINNEAKKVTIESIELSISFGFKTKNSINEDIEEIFRSAEDLMYRVKLNDINSMRSGAIQTILNTLYEKDKSYEIHSRNVSESSERFATVYGMDKQAVSEVKTAGLLHDIGKIVIPISIITKEGKLTSKEYDLIKGHPEVGFRILNSTHIMRSISNIVLNHHERWDGLGYPRGIKAEEIPIQARIISIFDAFDDMTSERTYREILSNEDALEEIKNNAGTKFDSELVQIFVDNFDKIIG